MQARYRELVAAEQQARAEGLGFVPAWAGYAIWTLALGLAAYLGISTASKVKRKVEGIVDTWGDVLRYAGWAFLVLGAYRFAMAGVGGVFTRRGEGTPLLPAPARRERDREEQWY